MGLLDRFRPGPRVRGEPTSSNGASSLHLRWVVPDVAFREVAVTLEVVEPPRVDRLYFWALQVGFADRGRRAGGAHLGLQWHPGYPGSTAVNWGGYDAGGSILRGSDSALPGTLGNVNTRDFRWEPHRAYRLSVAPGARPDRGPDDITPWRGTVTDLATGEATVVRDLWPRGGPELTGPMTWSEVFARCEHPSVTVRWSDPVAVDTAGVAHRPDAVETNYQARDAGGCDNTTSEPDERGVLQVTATDRRVPQGTRIPLRGPA